MFAALAEEEPDKDEDGAAKDEEADFDRKRPAGSKENKGIDDAEANRIKIATGEDDFLSQWEITVSEGILSAVIWVAEQFAIKDEF